MDRIKTAIIDGIKQGNEKDLRALYDQYSGILIAYAKQTIRNPLLAEDFVQDAFCTIWENRDKLNADQSIQAYLFKLVYRRCVDYLRKQMVHEEFQQYSERKLKELELMQGSFENLIISDITSREMWDIVQQTLLNSSEQSREIFLLSRERSLKNHEIADKIGVSVKTIEYHISKVLQQLRNSLKEFL